MVRAKASKRVSLSERLAEAKEELRLALGEVKTRRDERDKERFARSLADEGKVQAEGQAIVAEREAYRLYGKLAACWGFLQSVDTDAARQFCERLGLDPGMFPYP